MDRKNIYTTSRECGRGGGVIRVRHNSQTINAAAILLALALGVFAAGCTTRGAKVVEGVDFSAGVDFPVAEGAAELSFVNYLSGFRFSADRNYGMACEFESTNRFSFAFGLYESENVKRFKAKCRPCYTNVPPQTAREPKTESAKPPPPDGDAYLQYLQRGKRGCGKDGCECLNCPCAPSSCPCRDCGNGIGVCGCPARMETPQ